VHNSISTVLTQYFLAWRGPYRILHPCQVIAPNLRTVVTNRPALLPTTEITLSLQRLLPFLVAQQYESFHFPVVEVTELVLLFPVTLAHCLRLR
jgi:hypothetical protein